jgi:hypothetical protein
MDTRKLLFVAVNTALMILASPLVNAQEEESLPRRILKWTEGEQIGWLNSYLREGMPVDDTPGMLVLNRSSIVLPVLEHEIEEILSSSSPRDLFMSHLPTRNGSSGGALQRSRTPATKWRFCRRANSSRSTSSVLAV